MIWKFGKTLPQMKKKYPDKQAKKFKIFIDIILFPGVLKRFGLLNKGVIKSK